MKVFSDTKNTKQNIKMKKKQRKKQNCSNRFVLRFVENIRFEYMKKENY